jgi:hypothetical protein
VGKERLQTQERADGLVEERLRALTARHSEEMQRVVAEMEAHEAQVEAL